MRELRVEDALLYLDQVKVEFGDRPHIYNEFLDIMKTFKTQQIDTPGVIRRVSNLFQGNRRLVLGFNTFLPEGYKIELPDGDGPPVAVFRSPGETITHVLTGPHVPPIRQLDPSTAEMAQKPHAMAGGPGRPVGMQISQQGQVYPGGHPGLEAMMARGDVRGPGGQQQIASQHNGGLLDRSPAGAASFQHQPAMHVSHGEPRGHLDQQHLGGRQVDPHGLLVSGGAPVGNARLGMGQGQIAPQPGSPDGKVLARPVGNLAGSNGQRAQPAADTGGAPPAQQPLEFDHAINYVTTIKKRFADEPETYKKFLEILHTYQKEQRGIKDVLEEVSVLFSEHPDLLKEFTFFLPDAVQAEAKAQLEIVVKEAEERKRALTAPRQAAQAQRAAPASTPLHVESRVSLPSAPPLPSARIAFGATQPRSAEREKEIQRSAVYGKVSFGPPRPPRKNALTISQASQKNGRPTMLPPLPPQPTTAETAFFERAKRHLSRRELAPDKPSGRVRHTPYTEFLKCLHLFGAGVLNKDELILLLRGLFVQGHAPKSGVNAGGGASNPAIANDAHELLKEFEEILIGRGPYADQQSAQKDKSKYGAKRTRDFDFRDLKRPTPSYAEYPKDYPADLFMSHTGQTEQDLQVLNNALVCTGGCSCEDYDAIKMRRNVYEEIMFRIEDERFEVDMAIERNALAMRQIEPIAEEVQMLREGEEKDGQPIGRLQYKLKARTLNSIQINAIGRVYGENGDEVIQHLARNPLAVLPIVYQRLRQKDQEWRKQKSEMMPRWKAACEANYEGSMDFLCFFNRRDLERSFGLEQLREECKLAREYCSSPDKRTSAVSFGLSVPDRSAVLYEPYVVVEMKPDSPVHHKAVQLLIEHIGRKCFSRQDIREKVGRIWTEFMMSFFNYPAYWMMAEACKSFRGRINNFVIRYATGERVMTAYGRGTILAFMDTNDGPRYRVKLPYGIAFLQPFAIMHNVDAEDGSKYVRRDDEMIKQNENPVAEGMDISSSVVVDKKFKLLFGSDSIYLFLRLYSFLISLLDDIEGHLRVNPTMVDPTLAYYNPMKSTDDKPEAERKLDFVAVMAKLGEVTSKQLSMKDFEAFCRRVNRDIVHKMAVLPKMVEKCGDLMMKVSEEDLLPHLFDICQYNGQNPVTLRAACFVISPDVSYRIQYNRSNGRLYFSYLPEGEELSTVPTGDDDDDDEMDDNEVEDDYDDEDDMDLDHEEEDLREVKRLKVR